MCIQFIQLFSSMKYIMGNWRIFLEKKRTLKEGFDQVPPEESEWASLEQDADEVIIDEIEATYDALMSDLDGVHDPKMKIEIIKMFQNALKLDTSDMFQ